MIKFKIESFGIFKGPAKNFLNTSCKELSNIFTLSDVQFGGYFSISILKKLATVKKHDAKITLRKGRGYHIFIRVINKEDAENRKKNLANMKRLAVKLSKSEDVKDYYNIVRKIKTIDHGYMAPHIL